MRHSPLHLVVPLALMATVVATTPASLAADAEDCLTSASTAHAIERIAGVDRWETAACVSAVTYPDGNDTVIVARGDEAGGWADALAGTVLSRALDAPILLTAPTVLQKATADEVLRLGADEVIVLGGPGAISQSVANDLAALGTTVRRIAGDSREETAARIAREAGAGDIAFLVNGTRPADALVAGATAARQGAALLLAGSGHLPEATLAAFDDLDVDEVVIVGGASVIGAPVHQQLRARFGAANVTRIAGPNRAETAASMARAFPVGGQVHLVGGANRSLVDAIGASWLAARPGGGPVLYVEHDQLGNGTDRWLHVGGLDGDDEFVVVGGPGVVGRSTIQQLEGRLDTFLGTGFDAEVRGMWVHLFDGSLKSPEAIDHVLDAAVDANMNTIIVQTARRHDAYYVTDQIPRTVDPTMPADLDLLATLVPAAHARGLAVHAWYSLMPSWHSVYNDLPVQDWHVHEAHGVDSGDSWITNDADPRYAFMDPGVPGVHDHVVDMLVDVVERYDVDAVHLDYLRYAQATTGFHPTSRARFERLGNGNYDDWRRQQTSDLARRIWLEVTEAKPDVLVSMAAIAQGNGPTGPDLMASWRSSKAYSDKFQDWVGWLDEGIIDAVYPMAYFREAAHADWYDNWSNFIRQLETDRIVATGIAAYLNSVPQSSAQTDQALRDSDGLIVYAWQQDSSNAARGQFLQHLRNHQFAEPAPAPAPTFKTLDTNGHLLIEGLADGARVTASRPGFPTRTIHADATGHAGLVGLDAGVWTVTAGGSTEGVTIRPARVTRLTR